MEVLKNLNQRLRFLKPLKIENFSEVEGKFYKFFEDFPEPQIFSLKNLEANIYGK